MKRVKVTVVLTMAEATALWHAAGNTVGHPDAMEAQFPNPSRRAAAGRGYDKLGAAWARAEREAK